MSQVADWGVFWVVLGSGSDTDAKRLIFRSWMVDIMRKVCCVSDAEYDYPAMCHSIQKRGEK